MTHQPSNQLNNERASLLLSTTADADHDDAMESGRHRQGSYGSTEEQQKLNTPIPQKQRQRRRYSLLFTNELSGMVNLAIPVIATYLLEMLPGVMSILLVGKLPSEKSETYLGATALAVAFFNLFGVSIGIGLASAMDTLCSQAYGAQETHKMGVYLQTGVIVLFWTTLIVSTLIFSHASTILIVWLQQPPDIAELAGVFIWYLLPSLPFIFVYELLRKVLQAQNCAAPMLYVAIASNIVNFGLGYYLVYHTTYWGWLGAAVARTVSSMCLLFFLLPSILERRKTFWTGIDIRQAWKGVPEFLCLGIPGMLQLCFEWWAFECLALLCGVLPHNAVVAIGANAVVLNIASLMYMFYLGISIAANVRIGNALGANDADRASMASRLALGLSVAAAVVSAVALLGLRKVLPLVFTRDVAITDLSSRLIVVAAFFQLPDAMNGTLQGIFRGSGRQALGATLNGVAYYVLGIPLACVLGFGAGWGVVGLWWGMAAGLFLIASVGTVLVANSDWKRLAQMAQDRVHEGAIVIVE